jgi:hypothetical protein
MANAELGMFGQMAGQFGQLGSQGMEASFMPFMQQLEAMKLGQANSKMQQEGQLTGNDYLAQMLLGGTNANMNAQHSANELTGSLYNSMLGNLGGTQGADGSSGSGLMGAIGGGIDAVTGLFDLFD